MKAMFSHLKKIRGQDYQKAISLPGSFYRDPAWAEVEREQLFHKHWICVGRQEEVADKGDYMALDLAGEPIVVVHGLDGVIRALSNVCRHRGTVIVEGKGNGKSLLCPYHHWAYDTAGKLVHAPKMEGSKTFKKDKCQLPVLGCMEWQGFIFINLDPSADDIRQTLEPLEKQIGNYHLEEMHMHYLEQQSWEINWKSLVENFMEGYHLSPLHRATLHTVNPTELCRHFQPGEHYFGYEVGFVERVPEERIGHADLSEEELDNCIMFSVPPGLTVGIGSDYSSFLCIQPRGADNVLVKMGLIFHGTKWKKKEINAAIKLFKDTMEEDKMVLLRVQQGVQSSMHQPGVLAPRDMEGTIWDFYQFLSRSIDG